MASPSAGDARSEPGPGHGAPGGAPGEEALAQARADPRRQVGRYLVLDELGRGGFGAVLRAWDPATRRVVAVKVLHRLDPRAQARFAREAQALATLRHPAIPVVHDAGEHQGRPFLVLDFVAGRPLAAPRGGVRDVAGAARLGAELARALQHAHEQGILHRDVKPSNVLLDDRGRPHLLDFGLASLTGAEQLTASGAAVGTPAYMAPEQAVGRHEQLGPATDVYGLAATLYDLLVGRPPFEGDSLASTITMIVRDPPEPPRRLRPDLPPALEAAVLRGLAKDPGDRPQSAEAFAQALERAAAEVEGGPGATRGVGRGVAVALAAGCLAATLGGAVAVLARRAPAGGPTRVGPGPDAAAPDPQAPATAPADAPAPAGPDPGEAAAAALARAQAAARAGAPWAEVSAAFAAARALAPRGGEGGLDVRVAVAHALAAARRGRHDEAREALALADEAGAPGGAAGGPARGAGLEAAVVRARLLASEGARDGARRAWLRLEEQDPDGRWALVAGARARLAAGDPEGGLARLRGLLAAPGRREAGPPDGARAPGAGPEADALGLLEPEAWFACGLAEEARGEATGACQALARACALAPDDAGAWLAWGRVALACAGAHVDEPGADAPGGVGGAPAGAEATGGAPCGEVGARAAAARARALLPDADPDASAVGPGAARGERLDLVALEAELALRGGDHARAAALLGLDAAEGAAGADPAASGRAAASAGRLVLRGLLRHAQAAAGGAADAPPGALEAWSAALAADRPTALARLQRLPLPARRAAARGLSLGPADLRGPHDPGWLLPATRAALEARGAAAPAVARADLTGALVAAGRGAPWAALEGPLERARAAAPESAVVALEAARLLAGRDRYAAADDALARARALAAAAGPDPAREAEFERLAGEVLVRRGRLPEARPRLERAAALDPDGVEGWTARAELAFLARSPGPEELPPAARGHAPARTVAALRARQRGDLGAALEHATAALALEGALNARAWVVLGLCAAQERLGAVPADRALADLDRARAVTQGATPRLLLAQLALTAVREGAAGEADARALARAALEEARRAEPERAEVHRLLGLLRLRDGGARATVVDAWARALALDPAAPIPGAWVDEARARLGEGEDLDRLERPR